MEIGGILHYKGRILQHQVVSGRMGMCDVMKDLASTTFCVPLVDSVSPFSYSIVNEVHWHSTVLRYTQKYAHTFEGRELVKRVKSSCPR